MSRDTERESRLSRRDFFKSAGVAGAAASIGGAPAVAQTKEPPRREALETLTLVEADTLEGVCARLIPSDEHGPGAAEARAAHYIDRALGGALAPSREAYRSGLLAIDARAQAGYGQPFARLGPAEQDAVLIETEKSDPAFFALARAHTLQGTFGDPYYGGNANFVGWDLLSYPGVRIAATPAEQKMDAHTRPNHMSAYDIPMFNRASAAKAASARVGDGPLPDLMQDMSHAGPMAGAMPGNGGEP